MNENPPNFSQIDTSLDDKVLEEKFPLFIEAKSKKLVTTISPGDVLYIPAGIYKNKFLMISI